jgi:hypothetical protein
MKTFACGSAAQNLENLSWKARAEIWAKAKGFFSKTKKQLDKFSMKTPVGMISLTRSP